MGRKYHDYYSDIMRYGSNSQLQELISPLREKAREKIDMGELELTADWGISGPEAKKFMVEECLPVLRNVIEEIKIKDKTLRKVLSQLEQLAATYKK